MSSIFEASPYEHMMRRLVSSTYTLSNVAEFLFDIEDIDDLEKRSDLLVAVENLIDVAFYITERGREIGWQFAPVPDVESDE